MNILLLNDAYFLPSLRRLGHSVFFVGLSPEADWRIAEAPVSIQEALRQCPAAPDFILYSDSINGRAAFSGFEHLTIPFVFYGVDAPMNAFWQTDFCLACDLAFLDQRSSVASLHAIYPMTQNTIHWLPVGADHRLYRRQQTEKIYDLAFVGSLHPGHRPKRTWMLQALGRHFNLKIFNGDNQRSLSPAQVVRIYNQSRIVVNENLFAGINLRLFEAMSCGACLLTEEGDGSWKSFFEDGEYLVAFNSANLIERATELLADEIRRERIAASGMKTIHQQHTIDHRAATLIDKTSVLLSERRAGQTNSRRSFHLGKSFIAQADRWPHHPAAGLKSEGLRLLQNWAASCPEDADAHFELAAQALSAGRSADALPLLQRVLTLKPDHLRAIWALFWCWRELGEHYQANLEILRLRQRLGDLTSAYQTIAGGVELAAEEYLDLGEIMEKAGWLIESGIERSQSHPCRWNAFDAYQKAIALNPALAEPYLRCADLLEKTSCPEFALLFLEKAVSMRSYDVTLRLRFARLLLDGYRRPEGCQQIMQYLFLTPDADKWEKVEALRLSPSEWSHLWGQVQEFHSVPESEG